MPVSAYCCQSQSKVPLARLSLSIFCHLPVSLSVQQDDAVCTYVREVMIARSWNFMATFRLVLFCAAHREPPPPPLCTVCPSLAHVKFMNDATPKASSVPSWRGMMRVVYRGVLRALLLASMEEYLFAQLILTTGYNGYYHWTSLTLFGCDCWKSVDFDILLDCVIVSWLHDYTL